MKFLPCLLTRNTIVIYPDFHSTKQALWLVDSWSDALIKFKCILTKIQLYSCCPQAKYNSIWSFKGESNKALNVWSLRKLVSFVFPQVLMFPSTSPQETSGLSKKKLFPLGPYIKCAWWPPSLTQNLFEWASNAKPSSKWAGKYCSFVVKTLKFDMPRTYIFIKCVEG